MCKADIVARHVSKRGGESGFAFVGYVGDGRNDFAPMKGTNESQPLTHNFTGPTAVTNKYQYLYYLQILILVPKVNQL